MSIPTASAKSGSTPPSDAKPLSGGWRETNEAVRDFHRDLEAHEHVRGLVRVGVRDGHDGQVQAPDGPLGIEPKLKGSIGEGPNHSNFSDRSSVRILGIERKPRKTTSSKWHATQNTRRGRRKGKQTALRQRGGLRSRTNSNDAIVKILSTITFRNFR